MTDLKPVHDPHKSFYGLASVVRWPKCGLMILVSYSTHVGCYDDAGRFHRMWGGYSRTTMRHVVEFVKQFGGGRGPLSKKEWDALPVETMSGAAKKAKTARDMLVTLDAVP